MSDCFHDAADRAQRAVGRIQRAAEGVRGAAAVSQRAEIAVGGAEK
jgi:hypothetical protein